MFAQMDIKYTYTSGRVDIEKWSERDKHIVRKIIGKVEDGLGLIDAIYNMRQGKDYKDRKWAIGKDRKKFISKNKWITTYKFMDTSTIMDYGGGDGSDSVAMRELLGAKVVICADIEDYINKDYKNCVKFLRVIPYENLDIKDESVDIITIFYVIHHMREDIVKRLKDLYRILKKGGHLLIKEHDVIDEEDARAVNLQHICYYALDSENDVKDIIENFGEYEEMYYYKREDIYRLLQSLGFRRVKSVLLNINSKSYGEIYIKE